MKIGTAICILGALAYSAFIKVMNLKYKGS